jgi:hypothetical protein
VAKSGAKITSMAEELNLSSVCQRDSVLNHAISDCVEICIQVSETKI